MGNNYPRVGGPPGLGIGVGVGIGVVVFFSPASFAGGVLKGLFALLGEIFHLRSGLGRLLDFLASAGARRRASRLQNCMCSSCALQWIRVQNLTYFLELGCG